jgi:hypothetical protein
MASIIFTDATKLKFAFSATNGNVTISYPGQTSIVASGWRQWFVYIDGTNYAFIDSSATGTAGDTAASLANHTKPTNLTTSLNAPVGTSAAIIGNGDARPTGGGAATNFNVNIGNNSDIDPTNFVNVNITTTQFVVTTP